MKRSLSFSGQVSTTNYILSRGKQYLKVKMCHSRPLFSLFSSFQYTVDSKQMFNNFLPMTGFEPRTSGIGSDLSTN